MSDSVKPPPDPVALAAAVERHLNERGHRVVLTNDNMDAVLEAAARLADAFKPPLPAWQRAVVAVRQFGGKVNREQARRLIHHWRDRETLTDHDIDAACGWFSVDPTEFMNPRSWGDQAFRDWTAPER